MHKHAIEEIIFKILMISSCLLVISVLFLILGTIVCKGLPYLNWSMITQAPKSGYYLGHEGGILNSILGSLYLTGGATILAFMMSLPVTLYLNVYAKKKSILVSMVRFSFDVLWGVPSIVYGAFGFMLMLFFGMKASLLAGIITVAFLILPIMTRSMDEVIRMVPPPLLEASYALGATRLETALKVVVRQALPGISTAVLIAFGRGIGDAASLIFTAGFTDSLPNSLFQPVATLPLTIFFQFSSPLAQVQGRAYAAALILTVIILVISIVSRFLTKQFTRNIVR